MLIKSEDFGSHKEGAKVWDDHQLLEKLEGYSLNKIEAWHENSGGIKQIKLHYSDGQKSLVSLFNVYSEELPESDVYNIIELEEKEHVTKIQGFYNSDCILQLKIETELGRALRIESHHEVSDATEFTIEIKEGEQLFGFFGEYMDSLISFGVYQKKCFTNRFELGAANAEAVSSTENESLAAYSKGKYKIKSISIWGSENSFYGLQFSYMTASGDKVTGKKHSVDVIHTSKPQIIEFEDDEFLEEISGYHDDKCITYLDFKSSHGKHLSWGQNESHNVEKFQVISTEQDQLIVSRISYDNESLVQIIGFGIPTITMNKDRGTTFVDFEKKSAERFSRLNTQNESLPQPELAQPVEQNRESLNQNHIDTQPTIKTLLFPLKKEVSKSVVMPSRKTLHFYHQASERHALEKDFERKDVFAFLLWFGIGVNITQIMVGISTKPKHQGVLISSIVLSVLAILVLLNGLRIIGMKSLLTYNHYGFQLVTIIFFSFAVMIASFIKNESVGLSFFSLVTTIFLFPVYLKKRRILKEIFLFDPQREQFLSNLDPQSENTKTYKTPTERMKELMETAENIAKQVEAKKDRPSISSNKLDLRLDIE